MPELQGEAPTIHGNPETLTEYKWEIVRVNAPTSDDNAPKSDDNAPKSDELTGKHTHSWWGGLMAFLSENEEPTKARTFWQWCAEVLGLLLAALLFVLIVFPLLTVVALLLLTVVALLLLTVVALLVAVGVVGAVSGIVLPGVGIGYVLALAIGHTGALCVLFFLTVVPALLYFGIFFGKNVAWERKLGERQQVIYP